LFVIRWLLVVALLGLARDCQITLMFPEFTRFAIYFTAERPEDSGGRSTTELPKQTTQQILSEKSTISRSYCP